MNQSKGVVNIQFEIMDGNLRLFLNAPLSNQQEKNLTVQILAAAIPIALNYIDSPIIKPNGSGPKIKTH